MQTVLRIPVQPPDIRCRKAIADNGLCKPNTVRQIVQCACTNVESLVIADAHIGQVVQIEEAHLFEQPGGIHVLQHVQHSVNVCIRAGSKEIPNLRIQRNAEHDRQTAVRGVVLEHLAARTDISERVILIPHGSRR